MGEATGDVFPGHEHSRAGVFGCDIQRGTLSKWLGDSNEHSHVMQCRSQFGQWEFSKTGMTLTIP